MLGFGSALRGGKAAADIWQDREVRFDSNPRLLQLCRGEMLHASLARVEDSKGGAGDLGALMLTNLRLIWCQDKNLRKNLCIGLNTISACNAHTTQSRSRGPLQSLHLVTRSGQGAAATRFEFLFTAARAAASPGDAEPDSIRTQSGDPETSVARAEEAAQFITAVIAMQRSYEATKIYRDVKLRTAIIHEGALVLLYSEKVYSTYVGVSNISGSDDGNSMGTLTVTNLRIAWHSQLADNFNVSVPYLQMASLGSSDSRGDKAMVITVTPRAGGYNLGFRRSQGFPLDKVIQEVGALRSAALATPVFSPPFEHELPTSDPRTSGLDNGTAAAAAILRGTTGSSAGAIRGDEAGFADEPEGEVASDAFVAYYAEGALDAGGGAARPIVYSHELGLAVEQPPEGITLAALWAVA